MTPRPPNNPPHNPPHKGPHGQPRPAGARFAPGRLLATPGALAALTDAGVNGAAYFARHLAGDWGELDAEDRAANERALLTGERLLSAYTLPTGVRLWLITDADRSATTALLPAEY